MVFSEGRASRDKTVVLAEMPCNWSNFGRVLLLCLDLMLANIMDNKFLRSCT